jgi:glycosyltransferase involved in cell wall biosynthesis
MRGLEGLALEFQTRSRGFVRERCQALGKLECSLRARRQSTQGTAPARIAVLYVSQSRVCGGAELSLLDLLATLDREQYAPHCVHPGGPRLTAELEKLGVVQHVCHALQPLKRARLSTAIVAMGRASARIRAIVMRNSIRLVHANSATAALLCVPFVPRRVPVIWHVRDIAKRPELTLLKRFARVAITPSRHLEHTVGRFLVGRTTLIANGIDVTRFAGVPDKPFDRCDIRMLLVAHFAPWKGHDIALDAVAMLRMRGHPVSLSMLGGPATFCDGTSIDSMRRQIAERQLSHCVRVFGDVEDICSHLAQSDLLLHPAYPEPFGRVVVEAMAAGRAVVAFDGAHGPAEILGASRAGLLVPNRTAAALSMALSDLFERPERLRALSLAGRQYAHKFERSSMSREIEHLYRGLLRT